jgi:hypothetical protein
MNKLRVGINPADKDWALTCVEFSISPSSVDGRLRIKLETTVSYFMLNREKYKTWWNQRQEDDSDYKYIASNNKALHSIQTQFFRHILNDLGYTDGVVVHISDALFFLHYLFYKYGFYIIYPMDYTGIPLAGLPRIIGGRHHEDEFLKRKIPLYKSLHEYHQGYNSNMEGKIILLLRSNKLPKELLPLVCEIIWLRPFRSMEYNNAYFPV